MFTLILTGLLRGVWTHRALVLENLALRNQLAVLQRTASRPRLRPSDRLFWVLLSRLWRGQLEAVCIVQPETVIRWHRPGFTVFWTWKSHRPGPGRPAVALEVRALIRRMAYANPLWGAPRIHGNSRSWASALVSVDSFTVPTVMFKVLFIFVVLAHDRRRIVHVMVLNETHLRRLLREYLLYYDDARTHLPLDKDAPEPRAVEGLDQGCVVETPKRKGQARIVGQYAVSDRSNVIHGVIDTMDPLCHPKGTR